MMRPGPWSWSVLRFGDAWIVADNLTNDAVQTKLSSVGFLHIRNSKAETSGSQMIDRF